MLSLEKPEDVRDYLLSFDVYQGASQERIEYINEAFARFMRTLALTPEARTPGDRLLELGSSPYFMTLLLSDQRDYDIELANFFGNSHPDEATERIHSERWDRTYEFHYRNFNSEKERFPYPDEEFQVVLCCEIIEHLTQDPTAMLAEIHRVLKPDGYLVLTTPNILSLEYLRDLARGKNIFHPYSGYGVYGRHQREYTLAELTKLMIGCGYQIVQAEHADLHPSPAWMRLWKRLRPHRRGHLFVLAQRTEEQRYYYPSWLYTSTQAIHRVVSTDVRMGVNDVGHLGLGWWGLEHFDPPLRWTEWEAHVHLMRPRGATALEVEVCPGPETLGPVLLTVGVLGQSDTVQRRLTADTWDTLELALSDTLTADEVEVVLSVDATRSPADIGVGDDARDLGVMVRRVHVI